MACVTPVDADLIRLSGGNWPVEPALLLLDNCEHVLDAAAGAVERCWPLHPGYGCWRPAGNRSAWKASSSGVSPLAVPRPAASALEIGHNESVRLFEDRARLGQPTFTVDEQNAAAVASICRRLEGLPLGIELTAARVAAMSPATIAARLDDLTARPRPSTRRTARRHRSLDTTIDWSYQLLNSEERRLLRNLSVFAGGFTLEAVEAVAGHRTATRGLASLVNKSLVVYTPKATATTCSRRSGPSPGRRPKAGDADNVALRHLRWCAAFAEPV